MSSIPERVASLIDRMPHASVNAAAKAVGLPQRTLAAIVSGRSKNPRGDALRKIAEYFHVSVDWLLVGQGKGPDLTESDLPWSELQRWSKLIDTLKLPANVAAALYELPFGVRRAGLLLPQYGVVEADGVLVFAPGLKEALRLSVASWTELLGTWIELAGLTATSKSVAEHFREIRLSFSEGGRELILGKLRHAVEAVLDEAPSRASRGSPMAAHVERLLDGTIRHEAELRRKALSGAKRSNQQTRRRDAKAKAE